MKPLLDHLPAEDAARVELCRENDIGFNHVLMALSRKMEIAKYDPDESSTLAIEFFDSAAHFIGSYIGRVSSHPECVLHDFTNRLLAATGAVAPPGFIERISALSQAQAAIHDAQAGKTH